MMSSQSQIQKPSGGVKSWLQQVGYRIVKPHPSIQEIGAQRTAMLSAAISLAMLVMNVAGLTAAILSGGVTPQSAGVFIWIAATSVLSYILSRTVHFVWGSVILTVALSLSGLALLMGGSDRPLQSLYTTVPFSFGVGVALLPPWGFIGLVIFNTLWMAFLPMVMPVTVDFNYFAVVGTLFSLGIVLYVVSIFRASIEKVRIKDIAHINEELRGVSDSLEKRVEDRTRDLKLAIDVLQRVSLVRHLSAMLVDAVELIRERFNLYYTQIYLTDPTGRILILSAGTGEVGRMLMHRGARLPVDLASINGAAAAELKPVVVSDTGSSRSHRFSHFLPNTRSEMAIPLIAGERVVGVLNVMSDKPGFFKEENLTAFEVLAGQLAISIVNANLFAELETTRQGIEIQARKLTQQSWAEHLNAIDQPEHIGYSYEDSTFTPLLEALSTEPGEGVLVSPIQISGEPIGTMRFEGDHSWSEDDKTLVDAVSQQVSQQVENLRLLERAERFQMDAQQALHRLTQEAWGEYQESFQSNKSFIYDDFQVKPLEKTGEDPQDVLGFPIQVRGIPIGEFGIVGKDRLTDDDTELIAMIGGQLSAHIENLRLSQQTEQALSQAEILYEIGRQLNLATNEDEILSAVTGTAMRAGCKQTSLMYIDPDNDGNPEWLSIVAAWSRENAQDSPVGTRFSAPHFPLMGMLLTRPDKPFLIPDVSKAQNIDDGLRGRWMSTGIRAICIVPLGQAGQWLGLLTFSWDEPHEFNQQEETIFESLVSLVAPAVQSHRLFGEVQVRAAELATVAEVGTMIAGILNPQEMLQTVVNLARERFDLYHAHVYLIDEEKKSLRLAAGAGEVGRKMVAEGWKIPLDAPQSLVARAVRERRGVIVGDVHTEPGFLSNPLLPDAASELAVPLMAGENVLGVLDVQSVERNHFTAEDVSIQTTLASQIAVSLQNAQTYALTQRQAEHEALINVISQRIQSTTNIENALQVAIRELGRALGAKRTSVQLGSQTGKARSS